MTYDEQRLIKSLIKDIKRWQKRDDEGYDALMDLVDGIKQSLQFIVEHKLEQKVADAPFSKDVNDIK